MQHNPATSFDAYSAPHASQIQRFAGQRRTVVRLVNDYVRTECALEWLRVHLVPPFFTAAGCLLTRRGMVRHPWCSVLPIKKPGSRRAAAPPQWQGPRLRELKGTNPLIPQLYADEGPDVRLPDDRDDVHTATKRVSGEWWIFQELGESPDSGGGASHWLCKGTGAEGTPAGKAITTNGTSASTVTGNRERPSRSSVAYTPSSVLTK
jgi:hypothetical protein